MKNILCYGDSNTWGNIANSEYLCNKVLLHKRFEYGKRWTSILQNILGNSYYVIESGLNGRTTFFDEKNSERPSRNGLLTLPVTLDTHYPIDLVIFMLGTNDLKTEFNASLEKITDGMKELVILTQNSYFGKNYNSPKILIMSPPQICESAILKENNVFDKSSIQKSHQISSYYSKLAKEYNCEFLDTKNFVSVSEDGIHIDLPSQKKLAEVLAQIVQQILL